MAGNGMSLFPYCLAQTEDWEGPKFPHLRSPTNAKIGSYFLI